MRYDTIQDRARLKAAHDIAVLEYAQGWEAMLTLSSRKISDIYLIRAAMANIHPRHPMNPLKNLLS